MATSVHQKLLKRFALTWMVENDADIQRRQRSVPDQPEPPQAPELMDLSQTNTQVEPMSK